MPSELCRTDEDTDQPDETGREKGQKGTQPGRRQVTQTQT